MPGIVAWCVSARRYLAPVLATTLSFVVPSMAGAAGGGAITLAVRAGGGLTLAVEGGTSALILHASVPASIRVSESYLAMPGFSGRDLTGTGAGWHVTIQSSAVTSGEGARLPAGSLLMATPAVRCARTISCAGRASPPAITGAYPAAVDVDEAVTLGSAAVNTGMGTYDFQSGSLDGDAGHNLMLTTPPSAHPEEYSATLLLSMVSGP